MRNTILGLVLALGFISCNNSTSETRSYKLEEGITKKGNFEMINTSNNPPHFTRSELYIQFDLKLNSIENGNHNWELLFRHVKMIQGQPIGQDIYYDSNPSGENSALSDNIAGTYNALLNIPIALVTNSYGKLISEIDYDTIFGGAAFVVKNNSNLTQVLKYLFNPIPSYPIADGDSWDSTYIIKYSAPVQMTDNYEFVDADNKYGLVIETDIEMAEHPDQYDNVKNIFGTQQAVVSLSSKTNFVSSMSLKQALTMQLEQNDKPKSVGFNTTMNLKLY
jgi:hypothetical protein